MKDAWIRFRKSRASVVAAIIIIIIFLYAILAPLVITNHNATFMDTRYAKKPGRVAALQPYGILDGGTKREFSEKNIIQTLAIGVAAEDWAGKGNITIAQGKESEYQPILKMYDTKTFLNGAKKEVTVYPGRVDTYLEVGFIYKDIEQQELQKILDWEKETGKHLLYPLVDWNSEYCIDKENANYWYKTDAKLNPVRVDEDGNVSKIKFNDNMKLDPNYMRDKDGNLMYYTYYGGGDVDTAQYRIRVLYYNWFQYANGSLPDYIMGTDSVGYDLALRIAGGIKLSLMIAITVSVINFIIGAIYGAIEGYYGGIVDMTMERICDILGGMPFIIVATLFQQHLAKKVGPLACLIFAYVLTGWMGTSSRVRSQFYRFKNQEYVMAAHTLGANDRRIIWKHIFPNTLGTLITSSALVIPGTIMQESMLSFLGIVKLGGADGTSLGTLLSDASGIWTNYPHLMLYPAIIISLLMICFNLFGNGLRDAFNPALRGVEE